MFVIGVCLKMEFIGKNVIVAMMDVIQLILKCKWWCNIYIFSMFFAFFLVRVIINFIITRTRKNAKNICMYQNFLMFLDIMLQILSTTCALTYFIFFLLQIVPWWITTNSITLFFKINVLKANK